jgi:hypothetical protein
LGSIDEYSCREVALLRSHDHREPTLIGLLGDELLDVGLDARLAAVRIERCSRCPDRAGSMPIQVERRSVGCRRPER